MACKARLREGALDEFAPEAHAGLGADHQRQAAGRQRRPHRRHQRLGRLRRIDAVRGDDRVVTLRDARRRRAEVDALHGHITRPKVVHGHGFSQIC